MNSPKVNCSPSYKHVRAKQKQSPIALKEKIRKDYKDKVQSCRNILLNKLRGTVAESEIRDTLTKIYKNMFNFPPLGDIDEEENDVLEEIKNELIEEQIQWWLKEYEKSQMDDIDWSTLQQENVICPVCQKTNFKYEDDMISCSTCNIKIKSQNCLLKIKQNIFESIEKHNVQCNKAASSAEMRTLESLLGWETNDPEDNIVLKRIIKLIDGHLPLGWKEWKIRVLDKGDLLGNEFDPQILNKVRFAIPTVGLARAFSPECTSLKEKTYRDNIKLKLLKWPLCVGLIIHLMSLAARVRGSAVRNELIIASISDMRPLLKSREEANRELAAQSEQSEDEISVPSTRTSSSRSKEPSRLDKLEQGQRKLENMLEQFIKSFQPEDHSYSGSEKVSTSPEPSEDEENAPQLSVSSPKPCEPPTSLVNEDFDWTPTTREQEPLIPTPSQHIATQGTECQRLGNIPFYQIRYAEVQKKFHASPVFGPLKVNPHDLWTPFQSRSIGSNGLHSGHNFPWSFASTGGTN
ncbi:unnamed protein product [Parnassius apollo]|uniref:(apollo) hypothetical protein n=1 Tax=Parnassius apollo TaxID=110799 RepID=A0A8S3WWE9_PARAO|nr:unnamed protein product [Parnassius apollo]